MLNDMLGLCETPQVVDGVIQHVVVVVMEEPASRQWPVGDFPDDLRSEFPGIRFSGFDPSARAPVSLAFSHTNSSEGQAGAFIAGFEFGRWRHVDAFHIGIPWLAPWLECRGIGFVADCELIAAKPRSRSGRFDVRQGADPDAFAGPGTKPRAFRSVKRDGERLLTGLAGLRREAGRASESLGAAGMGTELSGRFALERVAAMSACNVYHGRDDSSPASNAQQSTGRTFAATETERLEHAHAA
jgi:hypothetical protein